MGQPMGQSMGQPMGQPLGQPVGQPWPSTLGKSIGNQVETYLCGGSLLLSLGCQTKVALECEAQAGMRDMDHLVQTCKVLPMTKLHASLKH